jgi:hypothetical protein
MLSIIFYHGTENEFVYSRTLRSNAAEPSMVCATSVAARGRCNVHRRGLPRSYACGAKKMNSGRRVTLSYSIIFARPIRFR